MNTNNTCGFCLRLVEPEDHDISADELCSCAWNRQDTIVTAKKDPMVRLQKEDRGSWQQTNSGISFYPLDPKPMEVDPFDVAMGLSCAARYAGQCRTFYPVAEHCVHIARWFIARGEDSLAREGLFHDGSEAYIGDMIRPLKHTAEMSQFRKVEDKVQSVIFIRMGIHSTIESHARVKEIDDRILVDEITQLQHTPAAYMIRMANVKPLGVKIRGWSPKRARRRFLDMLARLFPHEVRASWLTRMWWRYA